MSSSQTIIKLKNTVTNKPVSFVLSNQLTPSVVAKLNKRDELVPELKALDAEKDKARFTELYTKIQDLNIDAVCMILEPVEGIPKHYEDKRELLSDCLENIFVPGVVIEVFYKALSDSTASLEASEIRTQAVEAVEVIRS